MNKLLTLLLFLGLLVPSQGAIAFVASAKIATASVMTVTTPTFNTTGANFMVAVSDNLGGGSTTVSDNKGNTYTALTYRAGPSFSHVQVFYSAGASTGTGHTCTQTGSSNLQGALFCAGFSGVLTSSPFDVDNFNSTNSIISGGTIQTGSITTSVNGELLIFGMATNAAGNSSNSVAPGFTSGDFNNVSGSGGTYVIGGYWAFLVQGSAGAINPTLTVGNGSNELVLSITSFKPAAVSVTTTTATIQ